ncbi:MAG: hypothetical protein ACOC0W_04700 [Desulfosalsimonas sp.]
MRDPSAGPNPAKITALTVALVLIAVLGYFGWHWFTQWHEDQVQTAVEQERARIQEQRPDTREEVLKWLEENARQQPRPKVSDKRLEDVFGDPVFGGEDEECRRLERRVRSFFDYLEKERSIGSGEEKAHEIFRQMIRDLSESPPLVTAEERNLSNLLKNRAHFFRVLGKDRIKLIIAVLRSEKDVFEYAMDNFYRYFVSEKCCQDDSFSCIPDETLYEYAAFFLETLAGQSYLMRRDPAVRTLTRYYSVLVLDMAEQKGINRHGIDIRKCISDARQDVEARTDLRYQRRYLRRLESLAEKYGGSGSD